MGEIILLLCFAAMSFAMLVMAKDFRVSKMDSSGGAAMFPRIVIILLLIFIAVRIVQILLKKEKRPFAGRELFTGSRFFFVLCLVGYVLLLKPLGYILSTSLFLILAVNRFYRIERGTNGSPAAIAARNVLLVLFVLAMNWAFGSILSVRLPAGLLAIGG